MADYIKRADIVGAITSSEAQKAFREMTGQEVYFQVIKRMNETPAVDLVRCRECVNALPEYEHSLKCTLWQMGTNYNAFCSYGERKDDG